LLLKVTRIYPCSVPTLRKPVYLIVLIEFFKKPSKSSGIPEPGRSRTMCIENAHEQKRPGQNEYRFQSAETPRRQWPATLPAAVRGAAHSTAHRPGHPLWAWPGQPVSGTAPEE